MVNIIDKNTIYYKNNQSPFGYFANYNYFSLSFPTNLVENLYGNKPLTTVGSIFYSLGRKAKKWLRTTIFVKIQNANMGEQAKPPKHFIYISSLLSMSKCQGKKPSINILKSENEDGCGGSCL